MKVCTICGTEWKKNQKACPECDSEEWKELNAKLRSSIEEVVQEVVADLRHWIVELEFEVDSENEAETIRQWILSATKTFENNHEGHNLELVPVIGGDSKFRFITMYWRFGLDDGVLAVALVQRLVELRDSEKENPEGFDYLVGCRYEEDSDED